MNRHAFLLSILLSILLVGCVRQYTVSHNQLVWQNDLWHYNSDLFNGTAVLSETNLGRFVRTCSNGVMDHKSTFIPREARVVEGETCFVVMPSDEKTCSGGGNTQPGGPVSDRYTYRFDYRYLKFLALPDHLMVATPLCTYPRAQERCRPHLPDGKWILTNDDRKGIDARFEIEGGLFNRGFVAYCSGASLKRQLHRPLINRYDVSDDDALKITGNFDKDVRTGRWTISKPDGEIVLTWDYDNKGKLIEVDEKETAYLLYPISTNATTPPEEEIRRTVSIARNRSPDGKWVSRRYYYQDILTCRFTIEDGLIEGPLQVYRNDAPLARFEFVQGNLQDEESYARVAGLFDENNFKYAHVTYHENRRIRERFYMKQGYSSGYRSRRDGEYVAYYDNGCKKEEGIYKDGTKVGPWTYWNPDCTKFKSLEDSDDDTLD